jgi:CheY-like chemotaxis protein
MNRRKRILLVDDDCAIAQLCRQLLESTGDFLVATEDVGQRAVASARSFQPDLILLDYHLSDASGRDIASELRADPALCGVPIGFVTGAADEVGRELPVMAKPFCGRELVRFTLELLAGDRSSRKLSASES